MATTIDQAFITHYEREVKMAFQREGSYLLRTVRHKSGVVGSTAVFQKLGTGAATTKARHGTITPMNPTHSTATATLADFYAGEWVDKLDEFKTNIDERLLYASTGAKALGRKVDSQITTVLAATTESTVTLTVTSKATVLAGLITMAEALDSNDVPNDGMRFGALTPRMWSQSETVEAFSSADFVGADDLPFKAGAPTNGKFRDWLGIKWLMHSGLPGKGTATASCFVWHSSAVGYASGAFSGNAASESVPAADITWHGDRAAHFVNHSMSGGCVGIEFAGVIEGNLNDTSAIVTS